MKPTKSDKEQRVTFIICSRAYAEPPCNAEKSSNQVLVSPQKNKMKFSLLVLIDIFASHTEGHRLGRFYLCFFLRGIFSTNQVKTASHGDVSVVISCLKSTPLVFVAILQKNTLTSVPKNISADCYKLSSCQIAVTDSTEVVLTFK